MFCLFTGLSGFIFSRDVWCFVSAAATNVLALDATDVFFVGTTNASSAAKAADGPREAEGRA